MLILKRLVLLLLDLQVLFVLLKLVLKEINQLVTAADIMLLILLV